MADLVGNPEDRFSHDEAQNDPPMTAMQMCCGFYFFVGLFICNIYLLGFKQWFGHQIETFMLGYIGKLIIYSPRDISTATMNIYFFLALFQKKLVSSWCLLLITVKDKLPIKDRRNSILFPALLINKILYH